MMVQLHLIVGGTWVQTNHKVIIWIVSRLHSPLTRVFSQRNLNFIIMRKKIFTFAGSYVYLKLKVIRCPKVAFFEEPVTTVPLPAIVQTILDYWHLWFYNMTTCTGRNLVYCLLFYALPSIHILIFYVFPVNIIRSTSGLSR